MHIGSCIRGVFALGNTAQFPPDGLSTAPADLRAKSRRKASVALRSASLRLGVRHGICVAKMLDNTSKYYLRFWLSSCRTSLAVSALRIMRYCLYLLRAFRGGDFGGLAAVEGVELAFRFLIQVIIAGVNGSSCSSA